MHKAIDVVKAEPRTSLESWERWLNYMQVKLLTMPLRIGKKIDVIHITNVDCSGKGRRYCERAGEHSWFFHSQDNMQGELPKEGREF